MSCEVAWTNGGDVTVIGSEEPLEKPDGSMLDACSASLRGKNDTLNSVSGVLIEECLVDMGTHYETF